jgi:hypothetical protein
MDITAPSYQVSYSYLKLGCLHPVTCIRSGSGVCYFIQTIHYMFRSYDHLHAEIHTLEIALDGNP